MNRGITYLKQDFGIELLEGKPGMLSGPAGSTRALGRQPRPHPFTGVEITDKGVGLPVGLGRTGARGDRHSKDAN